MPEEASSFPSQKKTSKPLPPRPQGAASFATLPRFDLPFGDYRSGLDESALSGITAEACQSGCATDSRCLSFTFNTTDAICILKDTVPTPAPSRA
jgi:hypothetical protein